MRWPWHDQPASHASITAAHRGGRYRGTQQLVWTKAGVAQTLLATALALLLSSCGYTVLRDPNLAPSPSSSPEEDGSASSRDPKRELPPGHPPVDDADDWIGRSFLDFIVGEDEPFRFENVRQMAHIDMPSEHAELSLRLQVGGSAVSDVWQIRVDQFGWMSVARWVQGAGGPEVDETMATRRVELRLDRASEAALRFMIIGLLPNLQSRRQPPDFQFHDLARDMWFLQDSGLLTLDYRVETMDRLREDWPGGLVKRRLDLIQVLIGSWDRQPPDELVNLVYLWTSQDPALVRIAMLAEALVLAWEVEGKDQEHLELPLHVRR